MNLPPFPALRAFHAAGRAGRLRDAAAALGVTESAVSHQIRRLEEHLGRAMFERRPGGLTLTEAGARYLEAIAPVIDALSRATDEIMGAQDRQRVALTLPPSLATLWLIPRLKAFEAARPDVDLTLIPTTRRIDLARERVDWAIRYGAGGWAGVTAEFLLAEHAAPMCRPDDPLAQAPAATALAEARLITSTLHPEEWSEWAIARGLAAPSLAGALTLESHEQVLEAAARGLGWAMGRTPLADERLAKGELIAPFGMAERAGVGFHLLRAETREPTAAAKRVAAWLRQEAVGEAQQAAAGRPAYPSAPARARTNPEDRAEAT